MSCYRFWARREFLIAADIAASVYFVVNIIIVSETVEDNSYNYALAGEFDIFPFTIFDEPQTDRNWGLVNPELSPLYVLLKIPPRADCDMKSYKYKRCYALEPSLGQAFAHGFAVS